MHDNCSDIPGKLFFKRFIAGKEINAKISRDLYMREEKFEKKIFVKRNIVLREICPFRLESEHLAVLFRSPAFV